MNVVFRRRSGGSGGRSAAPRGARCAGLVILTACLLTGPCAFGQDADSTFGLAAASVGDIPHVDGDVTLDGVLDEDVWDEALVYSLEVETNPGENVPAPVRTTAYLAENGAALLVAFDARDPDPEAIRAYLRDRDSAFDDDFVGVVLDTFNDQLRAFEFFVNPLGVQMDLTMDDVNGNESSSWDAIWDSAGSIYEQGYVVEMVIPFSQLRFPDTEGPQTWGLDLIRIYPRQDRTLISITPRERGRNCYLCQLSKLRGFAAAEPGRDLEIVPSLTALRTDERGDGGDLERGDADPEVGVTVSWGIAADLTANLAINPDFSQVEADAPQLAENNRFALFFPEARPFFLEGADFFQTPVNAVFTRTIADPDVGARITGRSGSNAYGVIVAEDTVTNLLFPDAFGSSTETLELSNRATVARYSRDFGDASTIGALVTHRSGDDYSNRVAGIDGRYRINGQHSIGFQYLDSETEYPETVVTQFAQPSGAFGGGALRFNYDYSAREWFAFASYDDFDKGFRADTGFVNQVDTEEYRLGFGHVWHGDDGNWWNRLQVGANAGSTHDSDGRLLERSAETFFSMNGRMQSFLQIGVNRYEELWNGRMFEGTNVFMYGEMRPTAGINLSFSANSGDQLDFANSRLGSEFRIEPSINWNVNRHLLLRLQHTAVQLESQDGETIFDAQVDDFRVTWQFNLRSFLRFTAQHQDVKRNVTLFLASDVDQRTTTVASQLLYSYKLNPQTLFFAGYSDNYVDGDGFSEQTRTDRTFFLKLSYAWLP